MVGLPDKVSVWILGDQLLLAHPALERAAAEAGAENVHVVLVESEQRTRRLPYQRKKIVLLFSAMRHYARRLRDLGFQVDYVQAETITDGLHQHIQRVQPERLLTMAASEYHGRRYQTERLEGLLGLPVEVLPNTQFLVGQFDPFSQRTADKKIIMEFFYREMRRHFRVLMHGDDPVGGQWNFDRENRKPLPKTIDLPALLVFEPDDITQAVMREVAAMEQGVGTAEGFGYAVTHEQAQVALDHFIATRLPNFGAYEDAMSTRSHTLFHSVLSPYINLGLLTPLQMVRAAEQAYEQGQAPLNSVEGFVRQVMGWREFMYWQYWRLMPDLATMNAWNATRPMPQMFWDAETKMNCVHHVVENVLEQGYSHHIERLMIVANFCLLAGINPTEVTDWFMTFYIDAYDWVMQTNSVGMGLNADGGRIATKPYIASANYINKMSDYCKGCHYQYKRRTGEGACPFNLLYWNFLLRHEDELRANPRMGQNVLGLRHLDDEERATIRQQAQDFLDNLDYYEAD